MFRVIVAGSRGFGDYEKLAVTLDKLLANKLPSVVVVSGGAKGADRLGERYARERGIVCEVFPADWTKHGKRAGYVRNEEMAAEADALVAFWDGASPGTQHMLRIAKQCELRVRVVSV